MRRSSLPYRSHHQYLMKYSSIRNTVTFGNGLLLHTTEILESIIIRILVVCSSSPFQNLDDMQQQPVSQTPRNPDVNSGPGRHTRLAVDDRLIISPRYPELIIGNQAQCR